jgi:hypothetical protein
MTRRIDESEMKRKTYKAFHEDGMDALLAAFTLALVAVFFFDQRLGVVMVFGVGMHVPLRTLIRKRLTYPRIGFARLPEPRGWIHYLKKTVICLFFGLLIIPLLAVKEIAWLLPPYVAAILAGASVMAWKYRMTIDYAMTALFIISGIIGLIMTLSGIGGGRATAYQLWGLSAILIPLGLAQLLLFLKKYPGPAEEVSNVVGN